MVSKGLMLLTRSRLEQPTAASSLIPSGAVMQVRKYSDGLLKSVGSMAVWAQEALVNAQKQRQQSHPS